MSRAPNSTQILLEYLREAFEGYRGGEPLVSGQGPEERLGLSGMTAVGLFADLARTGLIEQAEVIGAFPMYRLTLSGLRLMESVDEQAAALASTGQIPPGRQPALVRRLGEKALEVVLSAAAKVGIERAVDTIDWSAIRTSLRDWLSGG